MCGPADVRQRVTDPVRASTPRRYGRVRVSTDHQRRSITPPGPGIRSAPQANSSRSIATSTGPILRCIAHLAGVRAVRQTVEGVIHAEASRRFRKPDDDEDSVAVEAYLTESPSRTRVRAARAKMGGRCSKHVITSPAGIHQASLSSRNRTIAAILSVRCFVTGGPPAVINREE
jgi:hypothetical protein